MEPGDIAVSPAVNTAGFSKDIYNYSYLWALFLELFYIQSKEIGNQK